MAGERQRLAAVARYDIIDVDAPERVDLAALCELAAQLAGVPNAVINLIDDRFQHQIATFGCEPTICSRSDSMCYVTILHGEDVAIPDAGRDERYRDSPWVDGRLGRVGFYTSTILRSPDGLAIGTLCVFDEEPRPVVDATRRALRIIAGQVIDVLELRTRGRQLQDAVAELSRSQEHLAAFAGQVSHDLKSPLTGILGFTELLRELPTVSDDPLALSYVERCYSSGQRMLETIEHLLGYARVGGMLRVRPVSLDEIMPEVLADLSAALDGAAVEWFGSDVPADPAQLRALLQNLVGNALAYRRADVPAHVVVAASEMPEAVQLHVVDNGTTIPPERRADALRPMQRLRKDVPGSGLGLATCARIAAAHGGTIALDESPGGGTTVIVTLPR
jgi:signal transduction histidine kinase